MAEEVALVNPNLVIRDKEGKPYSVRYDQVNAMLLNEFLKEHRAFVEGQLKVSNQQKEIDALKEELKEQRYLIQKVSDKVEAKPIDDPSGETRTLKAARRTVVLRLCVSPQRPSKTPRTVHFTARI